MNPIEPVSDKRTSKRDVQGIVLLDKPVGISSNAALQQVKRLFRARKAGHSGSLDPLAGGMLPITLGEATKMAGFVLEADKVYWTRVKLGVRTSTGDGEGEVLLRQDVPPGTVSRERVLAVLDQFTGSIDQIPPMHSAIKRGGQPLYKLAHKGVEVERAPRRVTINRIRLLACRDDELELEVDCSKGTYIRTLAEDIGARLGPGAHVASLRRLTIGPYRAEQMVTMPALEAAREAGAPVVEGGTYLCMKGPKFSTRAASFLYRSWGCDVIGMTNMPEAKLAREAEICYATVAMVTDYDCWHPDHADVTVDAVVKVLTGNAEAARELVRSLAPSIGERAHSCDKGCHHALEVAIITPPDHRDADMVAMLDAVAGRVLNRK